MAKNRGQEHGASLPFKQAYRPSFLKNESNSMVSPQVSPRGSQTNIAGMNQNPRPSVCSPSSLPLRQDAIFQSFPVPSPKRGSPRRSPGAGIKTATRTPPLQNVQVYSPRPSPRPSPRVTPQTSPGESNWETSGTESPVVKSSTPTENYVQRAGASAPPLDGGGSLRLLDGNNSNDWIRDNEGSNRDAEADYIFSGEVGKNPLGKEANVLGLGPHPPSESPESSRLNGKKKTPTPLSGSSGETNGTLIIPSNSPVAVKRRRTSGLLQFMRSPLTFPVRKQSGKGFIYNCIPGMSRKSSAAQSNIPEVPSPNDLPNNRISHHHHNDEYEFTSNSPRQTPPLKTPTPIDLSKVSTESDNHKRHHGIWRHKKHRGHDTTPSTVESKESIKRPDEHFCDDDPTCCYVAGEAHRFRTPLESPKIPRTPPTPSAISPKTSDMKGKKALPSYFDLPRQETSNVSPNDLGFTLMPLSDPDISHRTSNIQAHAHRLPHFVKVPMFSLAAPFATREDYKGYSAETSPEAASRRSSFPPGPGWSSNRSSASGAVDPRRASFGYRDHMNFITKPEGYSSRTGSSAKQESSSGSQSPHDSHGQRRNSHNTASDVSRKSSLGERRASKVIAALNAPRKDSNEHKLDETGGAAHSPGPSSKMVHWRGAEVTEEEAKMLDMLVGKHRLFSEMLMTPLEKTQSEGPEKPPEPGDEPMNVLRRPSWRRFASTIMSSPLSGLSEETGSSDKTTKPDSSDIPDAPDIKEMYAEALQETAGVPIGVTKNRKRHEDIAKAPSLPASVLDRTTPTEFITGPPDIVKAMDPSSIDAPMANSRSNRTTRTEFETEILSIAMLYGRVIKETTRAASEPSTPPVVDNTSATDTLRPHSRAPSLTVPERPSVGFITNALEERSVSDGLISDVRRVSLNPTSKSRRSSSTLARLHKLVSGGGEKSKRNSTTSPFSSPPEYVEDGSSRHQSLNVPSLISALTRANSSGKDASLGSMDGRKS
ncbi:hypothetical protein TWF481_005484 [Arthrobotrys musiformis]|uniref:Uncharacterized protein n=1 Tax=Arthrobotrys musiformis TaxID=47236 RepID=A0AAV9WET6_9PEZI